MTAGFTIRLARRDDLPRLIALRVEAERWLEEKEIKQWTTDYADYARSVFQRAVDDGAAWIVTTDAGDVVGTASLSYVPDPDFWGWMPPEDRANALYIGKMIVSLRARGVGLADAILNWASTQAAEANQPWLRLEVRRDNTGLQRYYLDRGFSHVHTWHHPQRRTESGWLAQRPSGLVLPTPIELKHTPGPISTAPVGAVDHADSGANSA